MEDDKVPRGILYILDSPEDRPEPLDSLRFEKMVCDLYREGRCLLPRIKWVQ